MNKVIATYLLVIGVLTFLIYGVDKWAAKRERYRVPEKVLIGLAAAGGTPGALLGMYFFHHKTRKPKFYIGIPLILLIQVALLYYLY